VAFEYGSDSKRETVAVAEIGRNGFVAPGATAVLILVTQIANASEDWRLTCSTISSAAETVMKRRQEGVAMVEMMEATKKGMNAFARQQMKDTESAEDAQKLNKDIEDTQKVMEDMVISAYAVPRYGLNEFGQEAIRDFRDAQYLKCVKEVRK
jgi:hypothetical protein